MSAPSTLGAFRPSFLTLLDLTDNRSNARGVAAVLRHLPPGLRQLKLSGNEATGHGALTWEFPPNLEVLEFVIPCTDEPTAKEDSLVGALPPSLKHLAINHYRKASRRVHFYFAKDLPPHLESLDISAWDIEDRPMMFLAKQLPATLRKLVVQTSIEDVVLAKIVSLHEGLVVTRALEL
ncbi:hypothetical protein H9P43_007584 [Blastocladiella emersonii ATCC 22665]|nr:hypothetical protein H9P43_007584 [Blastocladiella emersonii ATCC 22665]